MPAIHLFQRRTLLGGDDLQVPAICTILLRFFQGCCLILPLAWQIRQAATKSTWSTSIWEYLVTDPTTNNDNDNNDNITSICHNSHWFPLLVLMYFIATTIFLLVSCGMEVRILTWTCHGTPTTPYPRSMHIETLMEVKLLIFTVILVLLIITSITSTIFAPTFRQCHAQLGDDVSSSTAVIEAAGSRTSSLTMAQQQGQGQQGDNKSFWNNVIMTTDDDYYYNYFNSDQDDDDDQYYTTKTTTMMTMTATTTATGGTTNMVGVKRFNLKNHRFGSRVWWLGYSLLGFSQIAELVLTLAVLLNLLCKPKSISSTSTSSLGQQQQQVPPGSMTILQQMMMEEGQEEEHLSSPRLTSRSSLSSPSGSGSGRGRGRGGGSSSLLMDEEHLWATRCHTLCSCLSLSTCFIFGGRELWTGQFLSRSGAATTAATATTSTVNVPYYYNAVARALTDYLESFGVLDVVPTDLVMGLVVLQRVQRQRILESRLEVLFHQQRQQQHQGGQRPQQQQQLRPSSSSLSQSSNTSMTHPLPLQMLDRTGPTGTTITTLTATTALPQSSLGPQQQQQQQQHAASILPLTTPVATMATPATTDPLMASSTTNTTNVNTQPGASVMGLRSRSSSTTDLKNSSNTTTTMVETVPVVETTAGHEGGGSAGNFVKTTSPRLVATNTTSCRRRRQRVRTSIYRKRQHQREGRRRQLFPDEGMDDSIVQGSGDDDNDYFNDEDDDNDDDAEYEEPAVIESDGSNDDILYLRRTRQVLNVTHPHNVRLLQDGAHFARYALSIYTWLLYLYVHPISGVPKLLCGRTRRGRSTLCATTAAAVDCSSSSCGGGGGCCLFCRKFGSVGGGGPAVAAAAATTTGQPAPRRRQSPPHQPPQTRHRLRPRRSSEDDDDSRSDTSLLASSSYQQPQLSPQSPPQYHHSSSTTFEEDSVHIAGDTVCDLHKHSLLLTAEIDESELVYAQFSSSLFTVPYCILLDHATQSLVVSVRGTLSLEDLVTDVDLDPEPLESLAAEFGLFQHNHSNGDHGGGVNGASTNPFHNQYAHGGVVACVRNLYKDLQRHQLLERILLGSEGGLPLYPNYTLTLVGHSLGGAACTLLSYLLQPRFPNVRVWSYSPPGCTLTWELATQCQDWTTTFVLDSDLVPRLSLDSLEWLRNDVLQLIGRVKVPKYQVARKLMLSKNSVSGSRSNTNSESESCPLRPHSCNGGCSGALCGTCCCCCHDDRDHGEQDLQDLNHIMDGLLHPPDQPAPDTLYQRQLNDFLHIQEERKNARGTSRNVALYPPGRMIHLVKTGEDSANPCFKNMMKCITCNTTNLGSSYTPVWIANDDLDEIVVSPTMGTDHFVDRICAELEGLAKEFSSASTL